MAKRRGITRADINAMSKEIKSECERRGWNPYTLDMSQLKEIVTVIVPEKIRKH